MPSTAALLRDDVGTGGKQLSQVWPFGAQPDIVARYFNDLPTSPAGYAGGHQGWCFVLTPGRLAFAIEWGGGQAREAPSPARDALAFMQARTALSNEQIAYLLGVSRQTVQNWLRGEPISDTNLSRLLAVRDVLARAARHHPTPETMRLWLLTPRGADGRTPKDVLAAREIDRARLLAMAPMSPRVSSLPTVLREPTPPSMQIGRESRIEAYPTERVGNSEDLHTLDCNEPADEGWVE